MTRVIVTPPAHGYLTFTSFSVVYWPTSNYNGSDSFTFLGNDGQADGNTATVSITIRPVNDIPTALPQTVYATEDQPIQITLASQDIEGGPISFQINGWPTNGGTFSGIDAYGRLPGTNATLTYRPATNFSGTDAFWFRAIDGYYNSAGAWVTVIVQPVNDRPVATPQSVTTAEDKPTIITLSGSDVEDGALTYTVVAEPTNGTLGGTAPSLNYTPSVGSAGAARFTFRVNDGGLKSATATVSITTQNPAGISSAPTSLTITVPTATKTLVLNWSCTATNEDGFKIERSLSSGSGWSQIATTGINIHSFTNTGLTSSTR